MSALTGARRLPMWRALNVRDFRMLWASEAVSLVGDQFHFVAMAWLVIDLTRSGLALGTVLIAVGVPRAIMLIPFGVLADRRPPRSLMLVANLARSAIVGVIAALVLTGSASIPLLALLGAAFGVFDALYVPAQQAFLPRTLDADRLPSANALLQGTMQLATVVGPPIAGAAIAVVGTGAAFSVDALSFAVAAVFILLISSRGLARTRPATSAPTATEPATGRAAADLAAADLGAADPDAGELPAASPAQESVIAAVRGGVRHVLGDPALRTTLVLSLIFNFALSGPANVGMPWLAEIRFGAGPAGLGLLVAAWAAGALGGTLLAGNLRPARPGRVMLGGIMLAGAGMIVVGIAPWMPLASAALAIMGACIGYTNVIAVSWIQARVPSELIGRVMSLTMLMGFGITPLSLGVAGALLDLDATALFLGAGAIVVLATLVAGLGGFAAAFDAPPRQAAGPPAASPPAASPPAA